MSLPEEKGQKDKDESLGFRALPVVRIGRKYYFIDVRLKELRNVEKPWDRIEFERGFYL